MHYGNLFYCHLGWSYNRNGNVIPFWKSNIPTKLLDVRYADKVFTRSSLPSFWTFCLQSGSFNIILDNAWASKRVYDHVRQCFFLTIRNGLCYREWFVCRTLSRRLFKMKPLDLSLADGRAGFDTGEFLNNPLSYGNMGEYIKFSFQVLEFS